jgi:MFS family permease
MNSEGRSKDEDEEEDLLGKLLPLEAEKISNGLKATSEGGAFHDNTCQTDKATWRNLPHKRQLLLIALCRLSTPLSNACLIPYLYFLVKSIVSDREHPTAPQHISRLTGLLVAAFPIGQMMTSILWGRISDTCGRKPTVLLGLAMSVVANLAFGFSRTIGMLVFWRVVAGMANGIVGVMRTMTAEIVRERKHQPRAFLAPPVVFNSGRVLALAVGGCLADPVDNVPYLFGPKGILNYSKRPKGVQWALEYPYALPALFNGVVLTICFLAASLWLHESLDTRQNEGMCINLGRYLRRFVNQMVRRSPNHNYALLHGEEKDSALIISGNDTELPLSEHGSTAPLRRPRTIWTRHLCKVLFAFTFLSLHNATFLHIFPMLLSMPAVSRQNPNIVAFKGGLGLSSPTIGLYLALLGIAGIILQLFIYPGLQQRIGTLGVFRVANAIFPVAYIFAPYLVFLVDHKLAKWLAMTAVLFTQVMARTMAIPSSILLLTHAAPHRGVLGIVHGAGNTLSALAGACGPAIGGALLAKGIDMGAVGLVWWAWLFAISVVSLVWSLVLSENVEEAVDL